ncbi:MAG TPA: hypothetical protein VN721_09430 [Flavipsychrobacter sp.]|nr:hypothetical protein [Flavipsychrobacter sp.]
MKTTILKTGALIAVLAFLSLAACKKNNNSSNNSNSNDTSQLNSDDNGGYASDYARLEGTDNDVISISDIADQIGSGSTNLRLGPSPLGGCATITRDVSVIPHKLVINFGPTDCTCADGKNRRGKIIVYYTKGYKDSGSIHVTTFDGYYVNDNHLKGVDSAINMGPDSTGNVYYHISANDSLDLGPGVGVIKWTSERTRTWFEGYLTTARNDDQFIITGSATVTRASGRVFSVVIADPLLIALDCPWIEKGTVTITPVSPTGTVRTLDYGDFINCDSEAILTIGSKTYHITLR